MVAAFDDVEDKGRAVARQRWLLTPAAVVVTAGRGGSIGVGVGIGGSSSGGGGNGAGGMGGCRQ